MSKMDKYKIRNKAQVPQKVFLIDPATREITEDYLLVRSSLSDEFTMARDDTMQQLQTINEPDKEKRKLLVAELQLGLKVSLVAGWGFEEEFTEENVRNFLRESPQLQQMVTGIADDSDRFFGKPSEVSSAGPKKK